MVYQPNQAQQVHGGQVAAKYQKYRLFTAIGEALTAIKANAPVFFAVTFISIAIVTLISVAVQFAAATLFGITIGGLVFAAALGAFVPAFWVSVIAYGLISLALQSFLVAAVSLAVADGSSSAKNSTGATLNAALRASWRVFLAELLFCALALGPFFLVYLVSYASLLAPTALGSFGAGALVLFGMTVASVWLIIACLRYALIPYVALFEPRTSMLKTPARSKQLLLHGGQWFLVKLLLAAGLLYVLLGILIDISPLGVLGGGDANPAFNLMAAILGIGASAVLVMLYHNRNVVLASNTAS